MHYAGGIRLSNSVAEDARTGAVHPKTRDQLAVAVRDGYRHRPAISLRFLNNSLDGALRFIKTEHVPRDHVSSHLTTLRPNHRVFPAHGAQSDFLRANFYALRRSRLRAYNEPVTKLPPSRNRGVQAIETGATLLAALSQSTMPLTLTQVSLTANMPTAKAYRYLVSFCRAGLIA